MEFNLDQWVANYELDETSMAALAEKGFKSRRSISLLTLNMLKKEFKGLVLGQQLLLIEAVTALKVTASDQQTQAGNLGHSSSSETGATSGSSWLQTMAQAVPGTSADAHVGWAAFKLVRYP